MDSGLKKVYRSMASPDGYGRWITEASVLGFAPGQWPVAVEFEGARMTRTDVPIMRGEDAVGFNYRGGGTTLMVLND